MRLTQNQIETLKPCVTNATLTGKSVNVTCSGIASGKRALLVLREAYNPQSVEVLSGTERIAIFNLWQLWVYLYRYRDFTLNFASKAEAAECANDLAIVISDAVAEGVDGQGVNDSVFNWNNPLSIGQTEPTEFFKSKFFYVTVSIVVVIIVAVVGIKIVKRK